MTAAPAKVTKLKTILAALSNGSELTRFDAERLGDHCYPSTVARLKSYGVKINREQIIIEGRLGRIHCKRYRLDPDSLERARELLDQPSGPIAA